MPSAQPQHFTKTIAKEKRPLAVSPSIRAAHKYRDDYNEVSTELRALTLILLNILALLRIN